jgi:hypothetical protein
MADQPSPRRRFQFRLRTLMIAVTLFALIPCGYVGWQAKIVRERRALLDSIKAAGGYVTAARDNVGPPPPSWLRRILGDETVQILVVLPTTNSRTIAEIRRLFPDTIIGKEDGASTVTYFDR